MPSLVLKLSSPSSALLAPRRAPPSSVSSAKGGLPWPGGAQTCSPSSTYRYRSLAQPASAGTRLSSVSSHDSGFISQQEAAYSKPPSPMPSDITSQVRGEAEEGERGEMELPSLGFPVCKMGAIPRCTLGRRTWGMLCPLPVSQSPQAFGEPLGTVPR